MRPLLVSVKQVSSSPLFSYRQLVDALGRRVAWTTSRRIGLAEKCREAAQWRQALQACRKGTPMMFKIYDNKPVVNIRFDKENASCFPPAVAKASPYGSSRCGQATTRLIEKVEAVLTSAPLSESKQPKKERKPRSYNRAPKEARRPHRRRRSALSPRSRPTFRLLAR